MHIPDGLLPAQVCVGGYGIAGGITWFVLRQIRRTASSSEDLPKAAMLTAAFFVGSSINLPLPPASVHLVLNGLLGALLGWYAWPAILVGLLLQALLLGHGGLTTLGVDAVMIGGPSLVAYGVYQLRHSVRGLLKESWRFGLFSFLAGATGLGLSAIIFFSLILLTLPADLDIASEEQALSLLLIAHIPLMFIEGGVTTMTALFLRRIKPELINS
ncbi:cobalt transporter CbiM [Lyngbya confervoides]|uniref:Cobalt transporter CbiM n=1 Tax=Lyngbya confervoides BDU141951 TaxID=1574623 RepID=A0ABD4T6T4_9CYAN|nr:cobalt transporter CbiM [Lyngbya confervoides]MCM1984275.1 cobalt transporter CbiM [Lyngbya confervoides BDU141951]